MLNAVLFVLIGLEVLALAFTGQYLLIGLPRSRSCCSPGWVSVAGPLAVLRCSAGSLAAVRPSGVLTWGGLRGGISVALALSLPARGTAASRAGERESSVAMTYVVVVFSILVQGLTIGPLTRYWLGRSSKRPSTSA